MKSAWSKRFLRNTKGFYGFSLSTLLGLIEVESSFFLVVNGCFL